VKDRRRPHIRTKQRDGLAFAGIGSISQPMSANSITRLFSAKGKVAGTLRLCVTIALLVGLWYLTDGPEIRERLSRAEWSWLLAALITAHLQIVLSALRWRLTAAQLGQPLPWSNAIGEYYLSQLINLTMPGGILGDASRAVRQRHQVGMLRAAQAVMIERLVGQFALFGVLFSGFVIVTLRPGTLILPAWLAEVIAWLAIGSAGLLVIGGLLCLVPGILSRMAGGFLVAIRLGLLARGVWPRQLGLSLAIVACNLGSFAFCAAATGTDLPLAAVVTVLPLILIAMLIPVSVGGWGLREGAAATIWPVMGAGAEAGIAASIAFGFVILAASLPGLWVLMTRLRRVGPDAPTSGPVLPGRGEGQLQDQTPAKHC